MKREEAIGHIKDIICENNTIKPNIMVFEQEKEALYMAIKALEQLPKLQNRCHALTHGLMCVFCSYECEHRIADFEEEEE